MEKKEFPSQLNLAKEIIAKLDEAQLTPEEAQEVEGGISCYAVSCNKEAAAAE